MRKLEERPLLLTKSVKTPSAAGLLQMLPKQTKRTENGFFVSLSVWVVDDGVEAIEELGMVMGLCFEFCLWR